MRWIRITFTSEALQPTISHLVVSSAPVRTVLILSACSFAGEVTARLSGDTTVYYAGIADKVTGTIHYSITFIAGLVIGFTKSWQLTLIIFAIVPFLVVIMGFLKKVTESFESRVTAAYARAGDTATEVFTGIRTVAAYGGEESEVSRYDDHLEAAQKGGAAKGWAIGGAVGSLFALMFMAYGVGTWVGTRLIITSREDHPGCRIDPTDSICFTGGTVITTFMAVIIGAFALGQAGPNFGSFGSAQAAAYTIFEVIDRVPPIDSSSTAGEKPARDKLTGRIEFRNVSFAYPTRPDEMILRNYNLVVEPGTALALVGESGCGKSTVLQLLQRFYDPLEGQVLVDGIDVKNWNIQHLRDMIGVVSQDPVLFGTTVRNNIAYGKAGLVAASDAEITEASQAANAHAFIDTLPERYETIVGTSVSTTQLSGGQRQRICIARAIIRNPMYLFLDEATSALVRWSSHICSWITKCTT
jgi:ABC-type multidrug transport system fused ATPase/permease subunit